MRKDGSRFLADVVIDALKDDSGRLIGFAKITRDVTERVQAARALEEARIGLVQSRAEEALRRVQAELAHVARVTTMGELTASIAHEVNQPIAAAMLNAQAALRWLAAQPPDLDEAKQALTRIVEAAKRAGDVIGRIHGLIKKSPHRADRLDLNDAIREVVELTRAEAVKNGVSVRTELADGLPLIKGDRVELQQVVLNLIINAVEAMSAVAREARELVISTARAEVRRDGYGAGFGAGAARNRYRPHFPTLPHDQAGRLGNGAFDLPIHHRGPRRTIVGERERAPWRGLSVHRARRLRQRIVTGALVRHFCPAPGVVAFFIVSRSSALPNPKVAKLVGAAT